MAVSSFEWADLITILILVALEGVLSADNALVLAVTVLPLPDDQRGKALRYGMIGAFALRTVVTLLAVHLVRWNWVSLLGGFYLVYLPYRHFTRNANEEQGEAAGIASVARGFLGLSFFWTTVVSVPPR